MVAMTPNSQSEVVVVKVLFSPWDHNSHEHLRFSLIPKRSPLVVEVRKKTLGKNPWNLFPVKFGKSSSGRADGQEQGRIEQGLRRWELRAAQLQTEWGER